MKNTTISVENLTGKKVVVMGLGLYAQGSGIEAVKFFLNRGAKVTITDLRALEQLEGQVREVMNQWEIVRRSHPLCPKPQFVLGKHRAQDFKNADLIFQNPSVPSHSPYLTLASKHNIPIVNDWSIFLSVHDPPLFIGITGTRGKTTTTMLIYAMLKKQYKKVLLAGNVGVSPLSFIDRYHGEPIVAELSSWLLHHFGTVKKSPAIAVVTNIIVDHLDKYLSMREYVADKENIFLFQGSEDIVILNKDNQETRRMAKQARGNVLWFSSKQRMPCWVSQHSIALQGEHNFSNALAAAQTADAAGVPRRIIIQLLKGYKGVPHRLEYIRTVDGIAYYNDTTATTPDATIAALKTLGASSQEPVVRKPKTSNRKPHVVLIAGGSDKKLEYRQLTRYIKKYCKALILFKGAASDKLEKLMAHYPLMVSGVERMEKALEYACAYTDPGDVVLLSPGAASFGLFNNEFDRGEQFCGLVKKLK